MPNWGELVKLSRMKPDASDLPSASSKPLSKITITGYESQAPDSPSSSAISLHLFSQHGLEI